MFKNSVATQKKAKIQLLHKRKQTLKDKSAKFFSRTRKALYMVRIL